MVYVPQPYVSTGNNNTNNNNNNNNNQNNTIMHQQPHSPTRPQNSYTITPSTGYAPAPTGGYGNTPSYSSSLATTTSPYASSSRTTPMNTTPDFSQALNLPPPIVSATTSSSIYASSTINQPTPAYAPNYSTSNKNQAPQTSYGSAIAIPVNNTGGYFGGDSKISGSIATSALNSTTYSGGPTGGLISEGNPTICHKIDYEIKGHEMQLVEIELDPSETVIAEAGALMYMEDGIEFKTKFGDGSTPKEGFFKKLLKAGGRLLMGESLFITHFSNQGKAKARVAFAAPFPGSILPINLQNLGGKIICEKDAFLCAAKGTKLSVHLHKKFGSGLFGGEGFILQKLEGDGMVFIHAGGMVIRRELRGEKLRIDTGCVVAFTEGINFDIQFVPGLKSMFFGGEGLFLATLQGTGTVWLQSLPFSRFADRVIQHAPSIGGRRQGEGSALTGRFGDVINGDGFGFKL